MKQGLCIGKVSKIGGFIYSKREQCMYQASDKVTTMFKSISENVFLRKQTK